LCFIIVEGKVDHELLNSRISLLEEQFRREINLNMMTESEYRKRLAAEDPYISAVEGGVKCILGEEREK